LTHLVAVEVVVLVLLEVHLTVVLAQRHLLLELQ
jgi:hypothetical protein